MFTTKQEKFLREERVARLATIGPDGAPHVVPICFAYHEGLIYGEMSRTARRLAYLEKGGPAALLVDRYVEEGEEWKVLQGLLIYCTTRVVSYQEDQEEFMKGWRLLVEKYPPYRAWAREDLVPKDVENMRVVVFTPRRVVAWGFG
jgi:nitroimidazol reductase NimA-like FMN-containing flavoprotein (pyridoxamine 5'-phosphate oxidase superfamily)